MPKKIFTEEQKQYMRDNYLTKTYRQIGEEIGLTEKQVRCWVNSNCERKLQKINEHYFDNIDTSTKAYYLGLIYTDGCVCIKKGNCGDRYTLELGLQSQDKYILDMLQQELNSHVKIRHRYACERIILGVKTMSHDMDIYELTSRSIVEALINHNVVPRKSYSNIFPIVDDEFFFDFLRGAIDGDGCYYINKNNKLRVTLTSNSKKFLEYIQSVLLRYDICTYILPDKNHFNLSCSKEADNIRLINHLYYEDGLFCLQRKYEKIKHLIGLAA